MKKNLISASVASVLIPIGFYAHAESFILNGSDSNSMGRSSALRAATPQGEVKTFTSGIGDSLGCAGVTTPVQLQACMQAFRNTARDQAINSAQSYTNQVQISTLNSAQSYANIAEANAKAYADGVGTATLSAANSYSAQQAAAAKDAAIAAANAYTSSSISSIPIPAPAPAPGTPFWEANPRSGTQQFAYGHIYYTVSWAVQSSGTIALSTKSELYGYGGRHLSNHSNSVQLTNPYASVTAGVGAYGDCDFAYTGFSFSVTPTVNSDWTMNLRPLSSSCPQPEYDGD